MHEEAVKPRGLYGFPAGDWDGFWAGFDDLAEPVKFRQGRATKQIAGLLEISAKTAEFHRARIMAKLGVHDTAGLVRYAIREGLIEP